MYLDLIKGYGVTIGGTMPLKEHRENIAYRSHWGSSVGWDKGAGLAQ